MLFRSNYFWLCIPNPYCWCFPIILFDKIQNTLFYMHISSRHLSKYPCIIRYSIPMIKWFVILADIFSAKQRHIGTFCDQFKQRAKRINDLLGTLLLYISHVYINKFCILDAQSNPLYDLNQKTMWMHACA